MIRGEIKSMCNNYGETDSLRGEIGSLCSGGLPPVEIGSLRGDMAVQRDEMHKKIGSLN